MEQSVISCSPEVTGGMPVFAGTRVPIQALPGYLEADERINGFLAGFSAVNREQLISVLPRETE